MSLTMFVNISHSADLLYEFLSHYINLGVTWFDVGILHGKENPLWGQVEEPVKMVGAVRGFEIEEERLGARDAVHQNRMREMMVGPKGWNSDEHRWYAVADLDEFVVFPDGKKFQDVFAEAQHVGLRAIAGGMFDRVAFDGTLRRAWSQPSLHEQFPLCLELTKYLVKGNASKMVAARGNVPIQPGHHVDDTLPHYWCAQVHHYKWRDGLVEVLKDRYEEYKARPGFNAQDAKNVLDHLEKNGGRLNVEELTRLCAGKHLELTREIVRLRQEVEWDKNNCVLSPNPVE